VLRVMIRNNVNLLASEEVELFIKKYKNWSDGHKMVAAYAYSDFCKMLKIEWTPPKYRWKETIPFQYYNETKSIVEVSAKLGHRKINSTMVYTHIVQFDEESQNYHHAIARNEREAGELIDNGWTYILITPQNIMMFRKRK
jgi:hypothetical protein